MIGIKDCPETLAVCHCVIRHAITPAERAQAIEALEYAREVGDSIGTMIALAALTGCPSQSTTDQVADAHEALCHSDGSCHEDGCDCAPDPELLKVYRRS
jgi:hypothetical protein